MADTGGAATCGAEIAVNVAAGFAAPTTVGVGCAVTCYCGRGDVQADAMRSTAVKLATRAHRHDRAVMPSTPIHQER